MDDNRSPSLADVVSRAISQALKDTYVSCPAKILDYDATTQTATVQPVLERTFTSPDGTVNSIAQPAINAVPILFPGGGGFRIMWPLNAGDTVTLIMSDQSLDIWKSTGDDSVDPLDERQHHISDAVAIPALRSIADVWQPGDTTVITLGADGAAGAFVGRVGDAVTVTLGGTPGNGKLAALAALLISAAPGSPCTVLPASTLDVPGTITSGSGTVKILG